PSCLASTLNVPGRGPRVAKIATGGCGLILFAMMSVHSVDDGSGDPPRGDRPVARKPALYSSPGKRWVRRRARRRGSAVGGNPFSQPRDYEPSGRSAKVNGRESVYLGGRGRVPFSQPARLQNPLG